MATQSGFDPGGFGPFGAMFQTYFSALESFGRGNPSFGNGFSTGFDAQALTAQAAAPLKAAARSQLELMSLANRRVQAYMQVPTRLAHCRTPQDLLNEQMAFWRTAAEQYMESSRRITEAWGQALPGFGPFTGRTAPAERDYINFNGSGREASQPATRPEPAAKQRRVA